VTTGHRQHTPLTSEPERLDADMHADGPLICEVEATLHGIANDLTALLIAPGPLRFPFAVPLHYLVSFACLGDGANCQHAAGACLLAGNALVAVRGEIALPRIALAGACPEGAAPADDGRS